MMRNIIIDNDPDMRKFLSIFKSGMIVFFLLIISFISNAAATDSCNDCHGEYNLIVGVSNHNQTVNPSSPNCTDCHTGYLPIDGHTIGNKGYIVNETNTCIKCHNTSTGLEESHGNKYNHLADCTQCHFPNTTKPFDSNLSLFKHNHKMQVLYNFYIYNLSGMPLESNSGTGMGMFPYYTCTLSCHRYPYTLEPEASSWLKSRHANSYDNGYGATDFCASCKSPKNYNLTSFYPGNAITREEWKGIQCDICHNLHNDTFSGINESEGFPLAFYNSFISCYEKVSNATELCEKCHVELYGRKFDGYHKKILDFTCVNCHGIDPVTGTTSHTFEVFNETTGETGCIICHDTHTWINTKYHNNLVTCVGCHDMTISKNESGYAVTGIYSINMDITGNWTTFHQAYGPDSPWALHNISRIVDCDKCHGTLSKLDGLIAHSFTGNWKEEWISDDSYEGSIITTVELQDAIHHWLENTPVRGHTMTLTDLQDIIVMWLLD